MFLRINITCPTISTTNWPTQAVDAAAAAFAAIDDAAAAGDVAAADDVAARGTRPGNVTRTAVRLVVEVAAGAAARRERAPTSRPSWWTRARCGTGSGSTRRSTARGMALPRCRRCVAALMCLTG